MGSGHQGPLDGGQGSRQHMQCTLALGAHNTLQAAIYGGPFHRGRSRHREAKCLSSSDSASRWPVLTHAILPSAGPVACPWRWGVEGGRPAQGSEGTATGPCVLGMYDSSTGYKQAPSKDLTCEPKSELQPSRAQMRERAWPAWEQSRHWKW